jgi:hypothetical protein
MPIRFICPNPDCRKPITVKDEYAGRTGKCPACQTAVKVPAGSGPAPERQPPEPAKADAAKRPPVAKPAREPAADEAASVGASADRAQWYVQSKQGWLVGTHMAEVFDSTKTTDVRAYVWDGRYRLLGLIPLKLPLLPPRRTFVVRDGEPRGPIVLTLAEFPPITDYLPIGPARAARWEVRGGSGEVVGSILVSPDTVSLVKLAKGQVYQNEHSWLDANRERVGAVVLARSSFGMPGSLVVRGEDGEEYASFGTAEGERFHEDLRKAREGRGDRDVERNEELRVDGVIGCVSPERVSDRYTRLMTLGMTVLMQLIGVAKFTRTVSEAK